MGISLYLGPFQPFLEDRLLESYLEFREKDPFSPVTILVPNFILVGHLKKNLAVKAGKLFNLQIHTLRHYLEQITEDLVAEEGLKVLPEVLIPWVLKEVARPLLGKNSFFTPVSETPGFPHALRSTLLELREGLFCPADLKKTSESFRKAPGNQKLAQKLEAYASILLAYGEWKKKGGWMDREDFYEKVLGTDLGEKSLWAYGFYDAPALQKKVLVHLTQAGQGRWFIPYDSHPAFEYARDFVEWAKERGQVVREENWRSAESTHLERLQSSIFLDPELNGSSLETPLEESNCKILLCPGEPREAKEAARVLLAEADRCDSVLSDCAVILREPETYRGLLATAFQNQGLPLSRTLPGPLLETFESKTLLILLDCFLKDFPRDTVTNLLSSPVLNSRGFDLSDLEWNPSFWDVISREAKIVEGKAEWQRKLSAWRLLKERGSAEEDEKEPPSLAILSSLHLGRVLGRLFEAKTRFDREKTWPAKAMELCGIFKELTLPGSIREQVISVLESFGLLGESLPLPLSPEDFYSIVSAMLEENRTQVQGLQEGGAQIVDLMQARGVSFEVAVLPGLVEKSVPRMVRQDPLLLDQERVKINENQIWKGKSIPLKQWGAKEERLLFLLALRSVKKALVLTAPQMDPSTGSPRTPSMFLFASVEAVLGKRLDRLGEAPNLVKSIPVNDWIKPDLAHCADSLERLLTVMARARKGVMAPVRAAVEGKPFYFEGCELLRNRQLYRIFTAHDGIMAGREAREKLAQKNSLKSTTLSASRMETFAACPLRYFYKYVLGLSILEDPEHVLRVEPSDKGNLLHGILEETLRHGKRDGWLQQRDLAAGRKALQQVMSKSFQTFEREGVTGAQGLWLFDKWQMGKDLERIVRKVIEDEDWLPVDFEVAFGSGEKEKPVSLPLSDGTSLKLRGRMDRVDISSDTKALRVVDYKSGSSSGYTINQIKHGTKLQLPFYLYALTQLFPEKEARTALYDFITQKGGYLQKGFDSQGKAALEETLKKVLSTALECVEKGLFPAAGKNCPGCDYRMLCGTGAEERGERKREDPKTSGYYSLEELE